MNTVKKGDLFEEVCFGIVSKAILAGELGLLPASCRIYKKKGYYSKIRESDIIFDISIEVWLPNSERYTLVYFIECKDYSSSVPVNDLEEFYTKIDQVSGVNAKGVFMVKNSLQEGGRTFAKNQGMMVIEVTTNITYNIILHKANRYFEKQSEDFNNIPEIDAILFARKTKRTIKKLLIEHTLNHIRESNIYYKKTAIEKLSASQIEEMTKQLIACFDNRILTMGLKLQLDKFLGFMKETYSLTVCHCNMNELDENNRQILSSCSLTDKKISIDLSLVNTNRYAFIVAHEVGHFLLHNKLQISQQQYERYQDSIFSFSENRYLLANERNWIEWQANQFATCLLLPRDCILFQLYKALEKIGRNGSKPLYVDEQRCNQQDFHSVIGNLAVYFGTSKKSIIYRLNALEMIHFNYRMKSIGQILKELIDEDAFWLA